MALKLIYNSVIATFLIFGLVFAEIPADIEKCHYGDVECIKKVSADVLQKYPHGYESLKIPDLDPFYLKNATFGEATTPRENYDVKLQMTEFKIYGLSKVEFEKFVGFEKNPLTSKFEFYGKIPKIKVESKYNVKGKILGLPIEGNGDVEMEISDVDISMKIKLKESDVKTDGKLRTKVDKYKTLIDAKDFKVNFKNLFNGDKNLGDSMNELLNKNWKTIWAETKPDISRIVGRFSVNILNDVFESTPYEDAFLPD